MHVLSRYSVWFQELPVVVVRSLGNGYVFRLRGSRVVAWVLN